MIKVNNYTIGLMRQWGKLGNSNRSEKISAFNFAFIDGREKTLKARLKPGNTIINVDRDPFPGLLNDYYIYLNPMHKFIESSKSEDKIKINAERINFYSVTVEKTPDGKSLFKYRNKGFDGFTETFTMIEKHLEAQQKLDPEHLQEDTTPEGMEETIKFFQQFVNPKTKYLVIRTRLDFEVSYEGQTIPKNEITWHLIGTDPSECAEAYRLVEEFKVLPFDIDLGRVEELKV